MLSYKRLHIITTPATCTKQSPTRQLGPTLSLTRGNVGSLLRYFNVAVIPGFPDARICGRLPRFGTLVPGAGGPEPMWLWYFSCTSDITLSNCGRAVGRSL